MNNNDPLNIFSPIKEKEIDENPLFHMNEDTIKTNIEQIQTDNINTYKETQSILSLDNEDNKKEKIGINKKKKNILKFILPILIFVAVCLLSAKTFFYGKKINEYEKSIFKIEKKNEESILIQEGKEVDSNILKNIAASELVKCLNSKTDMNKLPDSVKNVINEINNYYNSSINYFAYTYKDIYTGFTVSYNANQNIFSASSIKAPKDIYLYEMASLGKIDLNEELTYTSAYYNTGSGILKNKPLNVKYNVKTLLEYSTVHSDNAAHNMLMDRFGRVNMLKFWQEKGTIGIFTQNTNWGVTNAHDATIYMEELYRFYTENEEYGTPLMNNFLKSHPKFIKGKNNYKVASKSGWAGSALHDMAIIFADNPYIVIGLSNLGDKEYQSYFNKINELSYNLHEEYWKYKVEKCKDIKLY